MSFVKTVRKVIFGLLAIAAISYGLTLYAQQQNAKLTPPPKASSPQPSSASAPENSNSGSPFVVGERLVYNVSWSNFPSAARIEMEVAGQGQFYGQESYQLRSKIETLGQVRSLFGEVDNQYTSYVSLSNALPHRIVNAIRQGQRQSEDVTVLDHSKQKATFSDDSAVSIRGGTYDLTSLIYGLRLRPLTDGSKYKFTALYEKELIEVEAVVKGRERIASQTGAYNTILIKFYPKGKYGNYRGHLYISDDAQRLPVMIKAKLPVGEARAELTSVTFASRAEPPLAKLDFPPEGGKPSRSIRITGPSGNGTAKGNGASEPPTNGAKPGVDAEAAPEPKDYPFVVGERLNYDISWGSFSSVGKASFEVRQQGTLNGNRVIEFFGEASSVGAARTLVNVNDQVSSLVLMDSLVPIKTDLRLREGKRSKQTTATYDLSRNQMSLSSGAKTEIPPGAYDILSLFYAVRAADLKIGITRDFIFFDANNRPQLVTIRVVKQESIGGPLGTRDALQVDVLAPEPARILLAQAWISNDARRLPLYLVTRTRFGELRFQMTSAVNTK
ncbi:MAG: DUF3108 domain-containing protein [Blastocatellia bacterium]